jgi:hypothetical protein
MLVALHVQTHIAGRMKVETPSEDKGALTEPVALGSGVRVGRYQVRRALGMGGMGQVYAAWDPVFGREVALKLLHSPEPRAIDAFKREFRTLADLQHPNFIQLHELACENGNWFFTMELVDGEDFYLHVCSGYDPSFARLRRALRQLADALVALHAAGKVHRDVKPSNVLIDQSGRVVLVDFGLVEDFLDPVESVRLLAGTVAYVSPEQSAGRVPSPASDWYSFGVMFYQGLTGRLPFSGTAVEVLRDKQEREPEPPASVAIGIPEELSRLCADLLRIDPAQRASGEEVLRCLESGVDGRERRSARRARTSSGNLFVGRPEHLAALDLAFQSVQNAAPVAVYLQGRSGMGKTALLHRFRDLVSEEGALFFSGRCYEREAVPYKGFDRVIEELGRYLRRLPAAELLTLIPDHIECLAQLFPSLAPLANLSPLRAENEDTLPFERRHLAFLALRDLLTEVARRSRLVLAIDDLQWGDPDTAALLLELMRAPAPPLLLILIYRTGERQTSELLRILLAPHSPLAPKAAGVDVRELAVGELSSRDATELAASLLEARGDQGQQQAGAIISEAGGNPFLLCELARFVNECGEQAFHRGDNAPSLDEVIAARSRSLGADAVALLEVAAVSGQPLPPVVALSAAGLEGGNHNILERLMRARLLRTRAMLDGPAVETYHDRIRESVSDHIDSERARELHQRIGLAYEAHGEADPERLAVHFHGAGDLKRAARYSELAADRAAEAMAFDRAARLYRLALEIAPLHIDRVSLQCKYAGALASSGRADKAAQMYIVAARGANGEDGRARTLGRLAAEQLMRAGRTEDALAIWKQVLGELGVSLPQNGRWSLLPLQLRRAWEGFVDLRPRQRKSPDPHELERLDALRWASCALAIAEPTQGRGLTAHYVWRALRSGDPYHTAVAATFEAASSATTGTIGAVRTRLLVQRCEERCRDLPTPANNRYPYPPQALLSGLYACVAFYEGRFAAALAPGGAMLDILAHTQGVAWEMERVRLHLLWAWFFAGDLQRLGEQFETGMQRATACADGWAKAGLRVVGTFHWLARNDAPAARQTIALALQEWEDGATFHLPQLWRTFAWLHVELYVGQSRRAWGRIEEVRTSMARNRLVSRVQLARVLMQHLRGSVALAVLSDEAHTSPRERRLLLGVARRAVRNLLREQTPFSVPTALALRAGIARRTEGEAQAVVWLRRAAEQFAAGGFALYEAACQLQLSACGAISPAAAEQARALFTSQRVAEPERFARTLLPGLAWAKSMRRP